MAAQRRRPRQRLGIEGCRLADAGGVQDRGPDRAARRFDDQRRGLDAVIGDNRALAGDQALTLPGPRVAPLGRRPIGGQIVQAQLRKHLRPSLREEPFSGGRIGGGRGARRRHLAHQARVEVPGQHTRQRGLDQSRLRAPELLCGSASISPSARPASSPNQRFSHS